MIVLRRWFPVTNIASHKRATCDRRIATLLLPAIVLVSLTALPLAAQRGGQTASTSASTGGSPSSGIWYARESWESTLALPDLTKRRVACYKLVYTNSALQPFTLQPTQIKRPCVSETDAAGKAACKAAPTESWSPCTLTDQADPLATKNPLRMGDVLVVAVDMTRVRTKRFKLLNLSVTNSQGNPINRTPLRSSINAAATAFTNLQDGVYYLTWPYELPGDTIPTISINAIYTPPTPGQPWESDTFYPTGSVVTPKEKQDGHSYTAVIGGVSGQSPPTLVPTEAAVIQDSTLTWTDFGATPPPNAKPTLWLPSTTYKLGDSIFSPSTGHYYLAQVTGTSGTTQPAFTVTQPGSVDESATPAKITDDTVVWQDIDIARPTSVSNDLSWKALTEYAKDTVIYNPANFHYYKAITSGVSGREYPLFPVTSTLKVRWQDAGTAVPTATGQPADQSLTLLSVVVPQVHALSYYNLASGIVVSSIRTRTFGIVEGKPAQTSSSSTIEPIIVFTYYVVPLDAEQDFKATNLIPRPSLGLSLSSPASSFYLGASSELRRNIQFIFGLNIAKTARLAPPGTAGANASSAATVQVFKTGAFVGFTFNISGFIQSVSGGGKGSGS